MTNLLIFTDTLTAIEIYCGDDIKYVETFPSWEKLLRSISPYFNSYAYIEIKAYSPKSGLFSLKGN
jgi:hypothetical protein